MQDLDELNMFFDLCWIWSKKTSVSSFYNENNFKPCLTKQLLNMYKLWCERGISALAEGSPHNHSNSALCTNKLRTFFYRPKLQTEGQAINCLLTTCVIHDSV